MREWLLDGFRYDVWANRLWASVASGGLDLVALADTSDDIPTEPQARMDDTFAHILHGQRMWLEKLDVRVVSEGAGWIDALHEGWMGLVSTREPGEIVHYLRPSGEAVARPFGDVAWHLINHGTYHRGQLREIADGAGIEWPETDVTLWRAPIA